MIYIFHSASSRVRESGREIEMNDTVVDETDGTIVTDFVYDENHMEKKSWKFCNNVNVPRSEVVFMSQMVLILILLAFCIFKLSLTFIKFNGFDNLRNLENILLVFDDSCEEIYNDKDFVKLATAGRHRGLDVIYVKHNLFQQSRWSRTIDLNTSHIILFKSPRDIQQLDHLGRQLNNTKFLRHCYQLATKDTYGHLLIDLDPRTSDCLRYCSNITPPGPSIFYLPINQAEVTPLTNEREKIIYSAAHGTIESQPAPKLH